MQNTDRNILKLLILIGVISFTAAEVAFNVDKDSTSEGKELSVKCKATNGAKIDKITFKGQKVTDNDHYEVTKLSDTELKLKFIDIVKEMGGIYTCWSDKGEQDEYRLGINFQFINFKRKQGIVFGSNDYIRCTVAGYPAPEVTWKRNGQDLPRQSAKYELQGNGDLLVKNVEHDDEGFYICHVVQERTSDEKNITVSVYVIPQINSEESTLKLYSYVGYSETIEFKCVATGTPKPNVVITHNGAQLYGEGAPVKKPGEYSVKKLTKTADDFGQYLCNATNIAGSITKIMNLEEAEVPRITKTSTNVQGTLDGKTNLECESTGKPSPQITWFRIKGPQIMPLTDSKYTILVDGTLVIQKTIEDDIGTYRCQASNFMGNDTADASIASVEAEPVFGKRSGGVNVVQSIYMLAGVLVVTFMEKIL